MDENLVVGVDIGASKICAAVANLEGDQSIKILGFLEKKINPEDEALYHGEVVNAHKTAEIIDSILEEISAMLDFDLTRINLNISSLNLKGEIHKGKVTKGSEGKNIVQNDVNKLHNDLRLSFKPKPGKMVLHSIPQDFYVNDVKVGEKIDGRLGIQVGAEFYFLTLNSETVENLYYTVKDISSKVQSRQKNPIEIDRLIASPIADSFVLLRKENQDKRAGVAIVNIGADITELTIFDKNGLRHMVNFPLAGNSITNDLIEAFNLQFEEAELLKKVAGTVPSNQNKTNDILLVERRGDLPPVEVLLKNATLVVEWRLKEIAAIVNEEIKKAGYHNSLTNGVILSGGTAAMPIVKHVFSEILKIRSIRKGNPSEGFDFNGYDFLNQPQYSTILGVIKASYEDFDNRIDNRILDHSPLSRTETVTPERRPNNPPKERGPVMGGIFKKIKDFIQDDNLDDGYSN